MTRFSILFLSAAFGLLAAMPQKLWSRSGGREEKVVGMWVDAHSNLDLFRKPTDVEHFARKLKAAGFNTVYLDVKPGTGYALYRSRLLPSLREKRGRDDAWDYLGCWLRAARSQGLKVYACVSTLGFGGTTYREGLVYDSDRLDGLTQQRLLAPDRPDTLLDSRDDPKVDAAMLNPALDEVHDFVSQYILEIATRYPRLAGICLDYCRWWDASYGMGPATLRQFGEATGRAARPSDILLPDGGRGERYAEWIHFRTQRVTDLVARIRRDLRSRRPKMQLQLWSATDWESRYAVGQNWASPAYRNLDPWFRDVFDARYGETSLTPYIDALIIGAYSVYALTAEYPETRWWAVEATMDRYPQYVRGACPVIGSVQAYQDYACTKSDGLAEACRQCLKKSRGLMVFELGHVERRGLWDEIARAVKDAER